MMKSILVFLGVLLLFTSGYSNNITNLVRDYPDGIVDYPITYML